MGYRLEYFAVQVLILIALLPNIASADSSVWDGDIIFQTSTLSQSEAVQKATRSRYSHMGVIFLRNGAPYVFEAAGTVKFTPLDKWIARGVGGHFVIKRLKDSQALNGDNLSKLRALAKSFEGRPYDLTFEWSDSKMYCSELVWKLYDRALAVQIGRLAKLREFDLTSPAVQNKIRERYPGNPPLDEKVISPEAIFESRLLEQVTSE